MYDFTENGMNRLYDCAQYGSQNDLNITVSPPFDTFNRIVTTGETRVVTTGEVRVVNI